MTQVIEPSYHMYFTNIFSHIIGLYWPSKQGRNPYLDSYVHQLMVTFEIFPSKCLYWFFASRASYPITSDQK